MKAIRKDESGNVPRNSVFNYLLDIDNKVQVKKHIVNKNEKASIALVDPSTGREKGKGVYSKMFDTVVESSENQMPKNNSKSKTWSNNDHAEIDGQDSFKEQASPHEQSEEQEAGSGESKRNMQKKKPYREQFANEEETDTEPAPQPKKKKNVNFVMNADGCFINGKPYDPQNPPEGIAIIADQKSALSEKPLAKRK